MERCNPICNCGYPLDYTWLFKLLWLGHSFQEEVQDFEQFFILSQWYSLLISYVTDGTTAILIGCLCLILPDRNPFRGNLRLIIRLNYWNSASYLLGERSEYRSIITWNDLSKSFPWGVFMLQGAGLAIADAFKVWWLSIYFGSFWSILY